MFILLTLNKYMLVGLCFFLKYKNFEKTKIFYVNTIKASDSVELLGIASDRNFNFKRHTENICCKAHNKTKDFFYIMKLLVLSKHKYWQIFYRNFGYCPLIWMFCGKVSDSLDVKTHYRMLRAIYPTQIKSQEKLFDISRKTKTHRRNIQFLMAEVYKCLNHTCFITWNCFN